MMMQFLKNVDKKAEKKKEVSKDSFMYNTRNGTLKVIHKKVG